MTGPARLDTMKKSPIIRKDVSCVKSWSKRELALAVLVIFAAVIAPYVVTRSLGRLLPGSATLFLLFLYAWVAALVMGVAFFFWAWKGRRVWPWILVLAVCLGLFVLWGMNLNLMADITGYYNTEATAFRLIYLIVCYIGMLAAAVLAAAVAWVLRKINY